MIFDFALCELGLGVFANFHFSSVRIYSFSDQIVNYFKTTRQHQNHIKVLRCTLISEYSCQISCNGEI